MALRCAAGDKSGAIFDGVLAVDPNLEKSTCVLTGLFSQLDPGDASNVVDLFRKVADSCETVDDWVLVHGHVINCVDKLSSDLSALVRQCQDIAGPFMAVQPGEPSPFIHWFQRASAHTKKVRCIFADDPQKRALIADIRMQHLENSCLGDRFSDDNFAFIPESRHLDLMRADVFQRHMDDFMAEIPA